MKYNNLQNSDDDCLTGRQFSEDVRLQLKLSTLKRYLKHKRQLLEGALTTSQVALLLNTSRQTPHDRLKSGSSIALFDNGAWRFPAWQFDPQGPDGAIAGLPEVLQALNVPTFSKLSWLSRPNSFLEKLTPIAALKQGQKERVINAALSVGVK